MPICYPGARSPRVANGMARPILQQDPFDDQDGDGVYGLAEYSTFLVMAVLPASQASRSRDGMAATNTRGRVLGRPCRTRRRKTTSISWLLLLLPARRDETRDSPPPVLIITHSHHSLGLSRATSQEKKRCPAADSTAR
jgi:hypothetical protein